MFTEILTYITEFHRKKLVKFEECKQYYDQIPLENLESEAKWLLGDATKNIPFPMIFLRCYALFNEMAERAACWPGFNDTQRMHFINATIDVKEEILGRAPPSTRAEIADKIRKTCKRIKKFGRYKKASGIILDSIRDYPGPFGNKRIFIIHPGSEKVH